MLRKFSLSSYSIFIVIFSVYAILFSEFNAEKCEPAGLNKTCSCGKCFPGLFCNKSEICTIDIGSCISHQWIDGKWKPKCEIDGTYSPVQCKGEFLNGRCFCYNSTGSRIFGWSWWKFAENMTCSCSLHSEKLSIDREDVSLHCAENGNYEEMQCDNGLCWCVEPMSGKPTQRVYPESMMTYLPCYNKRNIGYKYLRQCESKSVARAKLLKRLKYHGHEFFNVEKVFCDKDGTYGYYNINGKYIQCSWKDGKRIDIYQAEIKNIKNINCNCARDSIIFAESKVEFRSTCSSNGNYDFLQNTNEYPFCIDSDGFFTGKIGNIGEELTCNG
ncbi:uncharacterized protein LOC131669514 [Phymastichus coffea]|uniref:uncharacterized protein LOC131669514 n=1 Tax=Phymastichus coffea TaxID=108790 RepID=UPI00273BCE9C|nr:uncharacterized protein LOC131669514 [Phymastichus coffea]